MNEFCVTASSFLCSAFCLTVSVFFIFHFTFFFLLFIPKAPAPITETPLDLAKKCDPAECQLPYCYCSKDGTNIPGGLEPEDVSSR